MYLLPAPFYVRGINLEGSTKDAPERLAGLLMPKECNVGISKMMLE